MSEIRAFFDPWKVIGANDIQYVNFAPIVTAVGGPQFLSFVLFALIGKAEFLFLASTAILTTKRKNNKWEH